MQMTAKDIELEIYRSGLVRGTKRAHEITQRCKAIKKHAARYDRARLALCNGVPRWNAKAQQMLNELTEQDQERLDATIEDAQAHISDNLKQCLKPGVILDFRRDPRAAILRFVDKTNTRDGWIQ